MFDNKIEKLRQMQQRIRSRKNITLKSQLKIKTKSKAKPLSVFPTQAKQVFITGGIGDVIAVDSFLSSELKKSIEIVKYATNKHAYVKELLSGSSLYSADIEHHVLYEDFSNFWCFFSLQDFYNKTSTPIIDGVVDLSISRIFPKINSGQLTYKSSSFLKENVDIDRFELPLKFKVIAPYSTDKFLKNRDFNARDWRETISILQMYNCKGVVINAGPDSIPKSNWLIDLTNQLSLLETIEVLKKSSGYIGIDSWLSTLTTKVLDPSVVMIKSVNAHCIDHAYCYYAPATKFDFITREIKRKK